MSKQREALHIALEALEQYGTSSLNNEDAYSAAIKIIREALAEPEQEPVAEVKTKTTGGNAGIATVIHEIYSPNRDPLKPGDKLYITPPVHHPLTDEQIADLWDGHVVPVFGKNGINPIVFARAIERAHGIIE